MKDVNKRELIKKQLKGYQEALKLIPAIKEIAKKYEGKKMSKRFDTALKKVNDNLSFNEDYNSFRVKYYNRDRSISTDTHTEYIKEDVVDLVFGCIKSSYNDGICQKDVFNYETFVNAIDGRAERLQKYISETNDQLGSLEQLQKEKAEIEKLKNEYNDKINFILDGYYCLRIK